MSDESTATATQTETPSPASNESAAVDSSTAAKMQGSDGQADGGWSAGDKQDPTSKETAQAEKPAEKPLEKKDEKAAKPQPEFDPNELQWLESKGLTPASLDVKALIKNARNAETEMSKAVNQAKAKEISKAAANVQAPGTKPTRKTEIEKVEEFHNVVVDNICHGLGVRDFAELESNFPEQANRLTRLAVIERQKAWEREQVAQREIQELAAKEANDRARFDEEIKTSNRVMAENLLALKAKDKDLDANMSKSGVDALLGDIERASAWPKSFILSNPKHAEWFAKAAKALRMVEDMPKLEEAWKQKYEAGLKKQKEAQLPPASGGQANAKASFAHSVQKSSRGF